MKTTIATADGNDPRTIAATLRSPVLAMADLIRLLRTKRTDEAIAELEK
jgi:hypothetical protein